MDDTRTVFLAAIDAATPLLSDPTLADRFDGPSALAEFSVRGLAGHLLRAMTSVEAYLDQPEPDGAPEVISAADYYAAALPVGADITTDLQRAIRTRGEEAAPGGPEGLASDWAAAAARLRVRLAAEPPGRLVGVYQGLVLTLDDYLATRLVELTVHVDDLATSLGVAAPPLPAPATGLAVATLVGVARRRHGDTAVLRALTRRERDTVSALRVL